MEEMKLSYSEKDGILYPNLRRREEEQLLPTLGKYGMLALTYLKENEPERYGTLRRFGKLAEKMREADEEANDLMDRLMKAYLEQNKPKDPNSMTELWKIRSQGYLQAEEIVLREAVYVPR